MSLEYFFNPQSVAVVGASRKQGRVGYEILSAMKKSQFPGPVYPVNPSADSVLDMKCYPDLKAIPEPVDMVDIFRRPEHVLPVVKEAISIRAKVVWMQSGIINEEAAELAEEAGLTVIMDSCTMVDHMDLL